MLEAVRCKLRFLILIMCIVVSAPKKPGLQVIAGQDRDFEIYQYVVGIEIKRRTNVDSLYEEPAFDTQEICTGAYLTPAWVLTAAHCFDDYNRQCLSDKVYEITLLKWVVRLGPVTPLKNTSFSDIVLCITHPNYKDFDSILENDIALVKTLPTKLKRYGKLSAVDYMSLMGAESISAGYGLDGGHTLSTMDLNKPLQVFNVLIKKCPKEVKNEYYPVVCLIGLCREIVALSSSDLGGPIIHASGIVGVSSAVPTVNWVKDTYTKRKSDIVAFVCPVSLYIHWISDVINSDRQLSLLNF